MSFEKNKRFKKQPTSYSTQLRYDNLYTDPNSDSNDFKSEAFNSNRENRYNFTKQNKRQFQDTEDLNHELTHLNLWDNFKNICEALNFQFKQFNEGESETDNKNNDHSIKHNVKQRKIKINLGYDEEDDEATKDIPELNIKLKKVDSNLVYQKRLLKSKPSNRDVIYSDFIKAKPLNAFIPTIPELPKDYKPKYTINHDLSNVMSKNTATKLLSSRFTSSSTTSTSSASTTSLNHQLNKPISETIPRTTIKIDLDPLLTKRLGF